MKSIPARCATAAVLWLCTQAAGAATCTTWPAEVYLLRHAEKLDGTSNSPLSSAGWQRAGGLPKALSGVEVGAILVSDKLRTEQTALALKGATGIDPRPFAQHTSQGIAKLVDAICESGQQGAQAVVVVGHQSTVPKIMTEIGVPPDNVKRPAFGDLFQVNTGAGAVQAGRYGDCP
jgi:phosphohistidine phosphatase SixA